jgi:DNA-binding ferritin-like protein (Dps family)
MKLRRNKSEDSSDQQKPQQKKSKGLEVSKFEVSDNTIKFFAAKGLGKKQWIVVREIPILEIERMENLGNELNITWKGVTDSFFTKEKTGSFDKLVEQVNGILEEQRKTVATNEKAALRKSELLDVINDSIGIVDLSFDVLIGLQDKRVNWQKLEAYSNDFGENLNFTAQTLPPLNLGFSKIASAVKTQAPNEASKEAFNILKAIYEYFNGLNSDEDIKENPPNFQTAKTLILAYFLLNDLLFGKFVGDKENGREIRELETALQNLAEANFKVDVEELKRNIDKVSLEGDNQTLIEANRAIFKDQLRKL